MGHEPPSLRAWTQDLKEASVHTSVLVFSGLLKVEEGLGPVGGLGAWKPTLPAGFCNEFSASRPAAICPRPQVTILYRKRELQLNTTRGFPILPDVFCGLVVLRIPLRKTCFHDLSISDFHEDKP